MNKPFIYLHGRCASDACIICRELVVTCILHDDAILQFNDPNYFYQRCLIVETKLHEEHKPGISAAGGDAVPSCCSGVEILIDSTFCCSPALDFLSCVGLIRALCGDSVFLGALA